MKNYFLSSYKRLKTVNFQVHTDSEHCKPDEENRCELCSESFNSRAQFLAHINSVRHLHEAKKQLEQGSVSLNQQVFNTGGVASVINHSIGSVAPVGWRSLTQTLCLLSLVLSLSLLYFDEINIRHLAEAINVILFPDSNWEPHINLSSPFACLFPRLVWIGCGNESEQEFRPF